MNKSHKTDFESQISKAPPNNNPYRGWIEANKRSKHFKARFLFVAAGVVGSALGYKNLLYQRILYSYNQYVEPSFSEAQKMLQLDDSADKSD